MVRTLVCTGYGPRCGAAPATPVVHYGKPLFGGDRIIVSYSGRANDSAESAPTTLLLFDLEGNYLESWETGHRISDFCLDAENRRLILALDDAVQFAALDRRGRVDPA